MSHPEIEVGMIKVWTEREIRYEWRCIREIVHTLYTSHPDQERKGGSFETFILSLPMCNSKNGCLHFFHMKISLMSVGLAHELVWAWLRLACE